MLRLPPQHKAHATSCSNSNAICHHSFKKQIELRTQEQPLVAKHIGGTIRDRNEHSRNRRTDEVPFIAGCSHFTRKNTRFRAPASSPKQSPCNIMQQFQCDLPPQLQETHRTTHTGTTTRCKTHRRNNSRQKRPQPQPPHRRGTFHRRLQPFYTEKHKVSCSGFLPNTKPMQLYFVLRLPPQNKAHATSCSNSNAICHHSFKKRIELRTQEQPLVAKHIGGTIRDRNDRSRNRRTDEVPFIAGCSHSTRKNKVSCSGFLPNTKPMQHSCSHYNAFRSIP